MSALRYFLAAYFHQDWILEANHTRAVAERFAREEPRELVEETLNRVSALLSGGSSEEEASDLLATLGAYIQPSAFGETALTFLGALHEWISLELARSAH